MSPLQVIKESREEEIDRSFWKAVIIAVLAAFFVFFAVSSFNKFLLSVQGTDLLWCFVFALLFFVLFLLQVFFVKSRLKMVPLILLETLAPLLVFYSRFFNGPGTPLYLVFGAAVLFLALLSSSIRGQRELSNSLEIRFFSIVKSVLPRAVTGFILFLSAVFYLNYFVWGNFNQNVGRAIVNETLVAARPVVKLVLTVDFAPEGTVGDFLNALARNQLRRLSPGGFDSGASDAAIDFQRLPALEQVRIVSESSSKLAEELKKFIGAFEVRETFRDLAFRLSRDYLENLTPSLRSSVEIIAAVLFFFTVKGVAFLLYWLIEFMAFILFKFLLITGFAYITVENRGRQFILLS
ncbi:MAG: hypothetical protein UY26_C0003G0169 [Candidatus Jorgensenbacteria bacterium GW2011_GWA1_48_13]|uniref:Uncharacterized protein n=1 Tax=Candidatus Jorgensenbacteria bacterium GW2011_GWB1_50_10 TaxID=1618665 RepID=A0A0G1W8L8_9BACT|nr:MAG: hypothetical protein UY26_C0003G0169 [Candidatus Jorgensenbacteria bacterium GW2011_GWA1_48_13]KKW15126.1 MAG: hypothetical protein UY55_C0002G0184 [Candidatus Jorgensenbacteria bacterium GW2011_GWB1_50_10]